MISVTTCDSSGSMILYVVHGDGNAEVVQLKGIIVPLLLHPLLGFMRGIYAIFGIAAQPTKHPWGTGIGTTVEIKDDVGYIRFPYSKPTKKKIQPELAAAFPAPPSRISACQCLTLSAEFP